MSYTATDKKRWFGMESEHVVLGLLVSILIMALLLRLWRLGVYGYGNEYYAAAVKSMLQSWQNFFFIAAEPGGSVMVDKPPLGLWLQAISAWIFGVNGFSLALPSVLAGTLSVYILYLIVKAIFNHHAALSAAFFLAVLPGVVWVDRTNLLDSLVMCTNLIALWLLLNAILQKKWGLLVASFAVIGLGFNIKMMQAFLILPAMAIVYFFGMRKIWWQRILHLALATIVMLVISFSWVLIVDLTPVENRPYVSSTNTNQMMELVFGHNGLNRLISFREQIQIGLKDVPNGQSPKPPVGTQPRPGQGQQGNAPQNMPQQAGHGNDEIGTAGLFRLFQLPLAHQVSWLLGCAILSIGLVGFILKWQLPLQPQNQLYLLLGIWLVTEIIFFSVADFFHAYYLLMLGAPVAGLCGLGIWGIIQLWDDESWKGFAASLVLILVTVIFNTRILSAFGEVGQTAKILSGILAMIVIIGLILCTLRRHCIWRNVALMGLVLFLGSASLLWSIKGIQAENPINFIQNVGAPSYVSISYRYGLTTEQYDLLHFLEANTRPEQSLMVVSNSSAAAPYVLSSGRGIFTTGGFTGNDPVISDTDLIEMIESEVVVFILPPRDRNRVSPALGTYYQRNCQVRIFGDLDLDAEPSSNQRGIPILDCRKQDP